MNAHWPFLVLVEPLPHALSCSCRVDSLKGIRTVDKVQVHDPAHFQEVSAILIKEMSEA